MYAHVNRHCTSQRAVPAHGHVASLALIATAVSFLDTVLAPFLPSSLLLVARNMCPFLLTGRFTAFSLQHVFKSCVVMQEMYIGKLTLCCHESKIAVLFLQGKKEHIS